MKCSILMLLWLCVFSACTNSYRFIDKYIADNTNSVRTAHVGDHSTTFYFEAVDPNERALMNEYPKLQKLVHTLVPDSERFYHVTVFIPESEKSWKLVSKLNGKNTNAFTLPTEDVYVVFHPDSWKNASNRSLRKTAVHELIHHVSIEMYGDGDPDHERSEFWGPNGLVNRLTDQYIQESR